MGAEDTELNEFMPDDTNAGYDMLELLAQLGDDDELIEIQENYATKPTALPSIRTKAVIKLGA